MRVPAGRISSMPPLIRAQRLDSPNAVRFMRGDGVPEPLWSRIRAEWRNAGGDAGRVVTIPVEEFLFNLAWLGSALVATRSAWTGTRGRALLRTSQTERDQLSQSLREGGLLSPEEVQERLDSGRFTRELGSPIAGRWSPVDSSAWGELLVPGAGKTIVGLATYEAERLAERVIRLLVVSPISAFERWKPKLGDWFRPRPRLIVFAERSHMTLK